MFHLLSRYLVIVVTVIRHSHNHQCRKEEGYVEFKVFGKVSQCWLKLKRQWVSNFFITGFILSIFRCGIRSLTHILTWRRVYTWRMLWILAFNNRSLVEHFPFVLGRGKVYMRQVFLLSSSYKNDVESDIVFSRCLASIYNDYEFHI